MDTEKQLILLLAKYDISQKETQLIKQYLKDDLDWAFVLGHLHVNRICTLALETIKKNFELTPECSYSKFYNALYQEAVFDKLRGENNYKYIQEIIKELENANITYAVIKGQALVDQAYQGHYTRRFNDNDFLVNSGDIPACIEICERLNYEQGDFDNLSRKFTPSNRKKNILRTISSHEIYPFYKMTDDLFLDNICLDFQFSINLFETSRTDAETAMLLAEREFKNGYWSLSSIDLLIFTTLHFYKEAVFDYKISDSSDLNLYKMCDIRQLLLQQEIDRNKLSERIKVLDCEKEIYISLATIAKVLDVDFRKYIPLEYREQEIDYYYNHNKQQKYHWQQSVNERLFNNKRMQQIESDRKRMY